MIKGRDDKLLIREYAYDPQGKVSEVKEYPGFSGGAAENTCITKTYSYDKLDRATSMVYKNGSEVLESYAYKYDKNSQLTEKTEVNNTPKTEHDKVNITKAYTYNALGQLTKTEVTDHKDRDKKETISYGYDKAGNRTKKVKGSAQTSYTYNGLDQLLIAVTERDGEQERTITYEYDVNGNQVKESDSKSQVTTVNEYDAENRLSRAVITMPEPEPLPGDVAEPGSGAATGQASEVAETDGTASGNRIKTITQENLYNGDGQRVRKSEGAKETYYFYQDGVVSYTVEGKKETKAVQNLLGLEGNVILAERAVEISGEPTSEGGISGEKSEDGVAFEETKNRNFDYYLYNKDVQGSTTSILDEDGAGELSYEYDDFGETEINGNSVFQNEICYTGGIYDETTGLYYLNARYYDPENGRFLTEDTYRGELNEPDTLHLYVYCKNNPINYVDPSGHKFFGFWNNKQKYFAFNQDAPQKYFGYYDIYDYAAKYFAMDLVTRKFETKHWKLQFWKGKYGKMYGYGISSGCEIGLYYKSGRLCKCAYQKERMIRMSMTLYKVGYGKAMFSRDSNSTTKSKKAWWLTAFQPAQYMPGKKAVGGRQLIMKGTIYFNTSSSKYRSSLLALGKEFNKKARFGKRPGEKFTVGGNGSKKTFTWER